MAKRQKRADLKRENETLKGEIRMLRKAYRADAAQRESQYRARMRRLTASIRRLTAENHRLRGGVKRRSK
jgi:cell division protein FtsB